MSTNIDHVNNYSNSFKIPLLLAMFFVWYKYFLERPIIIKCDMKQTSVRKKCYILFYINVAHNFFVLDD